jgi:hypothetical protein
VSKQLTVNNKNLLATIVVSLLLVGSIGSVFASSNSPYQSGYSHGEDDCGEDFEDRYINQPGKGKSHHTPEFNDGYDAGFSSCSGGSSSGSGSGESRENLGSKLCRLVDTNRGAAETIARLLGYPGLDQAALALCEASDDRNN